MSDITIWRNTDPEDGTWTLGRFTGPTDDGDGRHAIWTVDEEGMRRIHALLGDVLNLEGQDQDVYAADDEGDAQPPTPEEEARQKVWDALAGAQRIGQLVAARREMHGLIMGSDLNLVTPDEIDSHPIIGAINEEISQIRERLTGLLS